MSDLKFPVFYHIIALFLKRAQSYLMFIFGVKEEPSLKVIFFTVLVHKNQSGFDLTIKIFSIILSFGIDFHALTQR